MRLLLAGELQAAVAKQRGLVLRLGGPLDLPLAPSCQTRAIFTASLFFSVIWTDQPGVAPSPSFCNSNLGLPLATVSPPSNWTSSVRLGSRSSLPRETASSPPLPGAASRPPRQGRPTRPARSAGSCGLSRAGLVSTFALAADFADHVRFRWHVGACSRAWLRAWPVWRGFGGRSSAPSWREASALEQRGFSSEHLSRGTALVHPAFSPRTCRAAGPRPLRPAPSFPRLWVAAAICGAGLAATSRKGNDASPAAAASNDRAANGPHDLSLRGVEPAESCPAEGLHAGQGSAATPPPGLALGDRLLAGLAELRRRCCRDGVFAPLEVALDFDGPARKESQSSARSGCRNGVVQGLHGPRRATAGAAPDPFCQGARAALTSCIDW